jgi:hypothetical protein
MSKENAGDSGRREATDDRIEESSGVRKRLSPIITTQYMSDDPDLNYLVEI